MFLFIFLFLSTSFILLNDVTCQRRIVGGERVDKNYAVYIVPSKVVAAPRASTAYFCGGAIISPSFVLTSAACVQYNFRKWVIAGYNKYITKYDLLRDKCATRYAQRVVRECVHPGSSNYTRISNFNYSIPAGDWRKADIAIVKVEKPFNFMDKGYYEYCSYPPNEIPFTTVGNSIKEGVDAMVLGWGSSKYQRPVNFEYDLNEKFLMAAPTRLANKKTCKAIYEKSLPADTPVDDMFDKYTICTQGTSEVDAYGRYDHNDVSGRRLGNNKTLKFEDLYVYYHTAGDTITYYSTSSNKSFNTRRSNNDPGPCQNDHGGPLVVWFGGREYLAGIASAFLVNEKMECVGPYLYTSIACAAKFLNCTMTREYDLRKQYTYDDCNDVIEDDYDLDKPVESNKSQDYWLYSD